MGLLGTVTGMIEVFEVMAISGSGNPRSMAAGVSKATVPTMAGMVAALSGVAMSAYLQGRAGRERALLGEHMTMDH
jgi:biopolymer transport protein ExbB